MMLIEPTMIWDFSSTDYHLPIQGQYPFFIMYMLILVTYVSRTQQLLQNHDAFVQLIYFKVQKLAIMWQ